MKREALAQIAVSIMTKESNLHNHNGLRFLATKGNLDRLVQIQEHLLTLGVVSWIRYLGSSWRLASTDSRLLLELEFSLSHGIPADLFEYLIGESE